MSHEKLKRVAAAAAIMAASSAGELDLPNNKLVEPLNNERPPIVQPDPGYFRELEKVFSFSGNFENRDEPIAQQQPEPLLIPFYLREDPRFINDMRVMLDIIRDSEFGSMLSISGFRLNVVEYGDYVSGLIQWENINVDVRIVFIPDFENQKLQPIILFEDQQLVWVDYEDERGDSRLSVGLLLGDGSLVGFASGEDRLDVFSLSGNISDVRILESVITPGGLFRSAEVRTSSLNLRRGPGTMYEIIGALSSGYELFILGRRGDWYYVFDSESGQVGYVYSSYVFVEGGDISESPDDTVVSNLEVSEPAKPTPEGLDSIVDEGSVPDEVLFSTVEFFGQYYRYMEGDQVELIATGNGRPDEVSKYWFLNIRRGDNQIQLPINELSWGGYVRELGVVRMEPLQELSAVYISRGPDLQIAGRLRPSIIVAIPHEGSTRLLTVVMPYSVGFSVEGSEIAITPTEEVLATIEQRGIKPGNQIIIHVGLASPAETKEVWEDFYDITCEEDPDCSDRMQLAGSDQVSLDIKEFLSSYSLGGSNTPPIVANQIIYLE